MDNLSEILTSPVWWITVVITGIAINVVSAYLKTSLDERISNISAWWRNRSEKRKAEFERDIQELVDDPQEQLIACYRGLRQRIFVILYFLFGTLFMISAQLPFLLEAPKILRSLGMFLAAFAFLRASVCLLSGMNIHAVIVESRTRCRKRAEQSPAGDVLKAAPEE